MKIIRNNKIYVQNKDLVKTMIGSINYKAGIPNEVVNKVFTDSFQITDENRDEFVLFEDKESIEFFNKLPFIVDYDEINALSDKEIVDKIRETMAVISGICANYNKLTKNNNSESYYSVTSKIDLLEHKFYDLRTILWAHQKQAFIKMPYELSDAYKLRMAFNKRKQTK